MIAVDRNAAWKDVWTKKGIDSAAPLHHANGYDLLSAEQWDRMVAEVAQPLGLKGDESILEVGCGAGAFLASLRKRHPSLKVSGVDYSPTLVARARANLTGEFFVRDAADLSFLPTSGFDVVASFGVFFYLSSEAAARRVAEEMLRLARPGGVVYIGEVSDVSKREEALAIRRVSHAGVAKVGSDDLDHLYLPKSLFLEIAETHGASATVVDHTDFNLNFYQGARYRFSVYIRKSTGTAP